MVCARTLECQQLLKQSYRSYHSLVFQVVVCTNEIARINNSVLPYHDALSPSSGHCISSSLCSVLNILLHVKDRCNLWVYLLAGSFVLSSVQKMIYFLLPKVMMNHVSNMVLILGRHHLIKTLCCSNGRQSLMLD